MNIKQITRWITLATIFLVPFFSVVVASSLFFPFITGKAFFFRLLVEIAFAGWVILAFWDAKYRPRLNAMTVAVTLFALIALVADLLGVSPVRSIMSNFERMEGWLVVLHLWMFFMAITYTFGFGEEGRRLWYRWLNTSLIVAIYVASRAALQWAGVIAIEQSASRPDSTLGNAAYLAVYMLIHSGLAAYLFFATKLRKAYSSVTALVTLQWVYAILAVFFGVIIYATATRGAIIGYVGGILLALILYAIFGKSLDAQKSKNVWRWISAAIVILVLLVGFLVWSSRDSSFVKKSETLSRLTSISFEQFKNEGRSYIWPMALKGFTQRPILGWGQENFNYIFNANYNPKMWGQEQWFDRAHSVYLDWLVASGVVGLLAYLSLYIIFLVFVWKSVMPVSMKSTLTGLLAAYAIHNIFVFDNLASYVPFFAILGLVVWTRTDSFGSATPVVTDEKTLLGETAASDDLVEYVVAPIVIIALIAGAYFWVIRPVRANMILISALQECQAGKTDIAEFQAVLNINSYTANQETREQMLSCVAQILVGQSPDTTKQAAFTFVTKAIEDQIAATPNDARIYTLAGSFLTSTGQYSKASTLLEKAQQLSPNKQTINFDLATVYLNDEKVTKAIDLLKKTYESATDNTQARLVYASALVLNGQEAYARELFNNDPNIFETETMAQVYISKKDNTKAINIYKSLIQKASQSTDVTSSGQPADINLRATLAKIQLAAGLKDDAIATLRSIGKDYPEYATKIEEVIKQLK